MKKHIYRAITINKINQERLTSIVRDKRIAFGVDVAKEIYFGTFMDEFQTALLTIKWTNLTEVRQVVELLNLLPTSSLEVAMEPSGTYGDPFRHLLLQASIPVHLVSPKRCHDAAEVYDGVPSMHDAKAAAIIAKLHLDGVSRKWPVNSDAQRGLRAAIDTLDIYHEQWHCNLNRLEGRLARHWPELTDVLELSSPTLMSLVAKFGGPAAVAKAPNAARSLMRKVGKNFLKEEKIEQVIAQATVSIGMPMINEEIVAVKELGQEALRNYKARAQAEKVVEGLSQTEPVVRRMSVVMGKVTAAVLYALVGDPNDYESVGAYDKALGINLKIRQSGKCTGQLRITKRGPGRVRSYLYFGTLRKIKDNEAFRVWHARKVARDGGLKGKSIVALMRKLAAGLWHVARGEEFDTAKLFNFSRLSLPTQQTR